MVILLDKHRTSLSFLRSNNPRKIQELRELFPQKTRTQMKNCLNIGCGEKPMVSSSEETWTNLDWKEGPGVDIVRDIRRGLPFLDSTFDSIFMDNVLEHLPSEDVIFTINEIDRVLKVGGIAEIIVPHADSQGAFQDPTHKSFWVPRSVIYWSQNRSKYGGKFVGITANLIELETIVFGNMQTEGYIKFRVKKEAL